MKFTLLLLLASSFTQSADLDDSAVQPMLEAHRWFDLRDAVTEGKSPALYRGLVAAAFNDIARAEREFRVAIHSGAGVDQQYAAHDALFNASFRNGLYRRAAIELKKKWALNPEEAPPDGDTELARLLERLPDLAIVSRKPAAVAYTTWSGGQIVTPLIINDQTARFMLDSDMNMSVITEAGAKRLGMPSPTKSSPTTPRWTRPAFGSLKAETSNSSDSTKAASSAASRRTWRGSARSRPNVRRP